MSKKFTIEEVELLVGKAMKIDSPLAKSIMAKFKDTPPNVQAEEILHSMNFNRFSNSGYVHGVKNELARELDEQLCNQIQYQFEVELDHIETLHKDSFELGYRIGMGAVNLKRIV